jgi:hypothetical protein
LEAEDPGSVDHSAPALCRQRNAEVRIASTTHNRHGRSRLDIPYHQRSPVLEWPSFRGMRRAGSDGNNVTLVPHSHAVEPFRNLLTRLGSEKKIRWTTIGFDS